MLQFWILPKSYAEFENHTCYMYGRDRSSDMYICISLYPYNILNAACYKRFKFYLNE